MCLLVLFGEMLSNANMTQILRPMARLGGITYGRVTEGIELPRPEWKEQKEHAEGLIKPKAEGQ